jgi:uncharacterized protein YjbI with pentapeptide repeats
MGAAMPPNFLARLKFGAGGWDQWRAENPGEEIILDGAKLDGMILVEADLLGANLTDARYAPADLDGALHVPVRSG